VTPTNPPTIVVRRRLPAPPEEGFFAWTNPESLARWMSPYGSASATVDLRAGGAFEIVMRGMGTEIAQTGEYREIQPPHRLVFTWRSRYTGGDSLASVVLRRAGEQTELELTHERLPDAHRGAHAEGWGLILDRLAAHLGAQ
jgi:uncharacterized protein YndB with AHSA1/START domain